MRVLHVDPDKTTTRHVQRQLAQYEIETMPVANGEEAIKILKKGKLPDLIILEAHISGRDGHQVLKAIRTSQRTKDLKVMFLTGMNEEMVRSRAVNNRVDGYVAKINSTLVTAEVKRLLGLDTDTNP